MSGRGLGCGTTNIHYKIETVRACARTAAFLVLSQYAAVSLVAAVELARDIGAAYGCTVDFETEEVAPLVCNGPEMTALARRAAEALVGPEHVVIAAPEMSSEDFAEYGKEVPSFFYWLGSGFPDRENAGWHSDQFRTNDSALPLDAALLARSALTALGYEG